MQYTFENQWENRGDHYRKQCRYKPDNAGPQDPWLVFLVVFYPLPSLSSYFLCYTPYPTSDDMGNQYPNGAYWCYCPSPNYPGYDPNSSPNNFGLLNHKTPDINQVMNNFGPIQTTSSAAGANFPGTSEALPNLPQDIP